MKSHLAKIEGLFKGFKQNLDQAFRLNAQLAKDLKDLENARRHETWMAIGHGIATVGLMITAYFKPSLVPLAAPLILGAGMGTLCHY